MQGNDQLTGGGQPRRIYMDYAAATPVCVDGAEAFEEAQRRFFANPGGLHVEGMAAGEVVAAARKSIAAFLGCRASQIVVTSGGTEGNNLALFGVVRAWYRRNRGDMGPVFLPYAKNAGLHHEGGGDGAGGTGDVGHVPFVPHVVVSAIEHPSVLEPLKEVERMGARVTFVQPDVRGIIRPEAIRDALTPQTVLVSVGWVNSEIGTIQPLHAIAQVLRAYERVHGTRILLHTDAGQGPLYVSPNVQGLGVDLMTIDSGKLYGPRGVGALFVRDHQMVQPMLFGGGQERGLRPGSENVALVAGCAAALEHVRMQRTTECERLEALKTTFIEQITRVVPGVVVNGDRARTVPHIVHVSIPDIHSEYVMFALDHAGVAVSTKSSCREGELESHVIAAVYQNQPENAWRAAHTLRFSFGEATTADDIAAAVSRTAEAVRTYQECERALVR